MSLKELYLKQKPAALEKLVEIAKIQSTEASNKIEGIVTTSTRLQQLVMEKTTPKNRDEEEIMGYRDVLNTIHESYEYIPIRSSYILQLHRDLYQYSQKDIGGRFKNTQNVIAESHPDGLQTVRFTPLAPYETPGAIDSICDNFNHAIDACIVDPLVLIPIFINDFLCIHPFNDGNGRMSRLLTTLLLYRCGYVVGRYISLESKIEKTKENYYDVLEQCAIEIVRKAVCEKIGKFTKSEIMELVPSLSKASVENSLTQLMKDGVVDRHGKGKATFYTRADV